MTVSTREKAEEGELDPRIRIRAPLRCDGIGRLDCAEDMESGGRLAVRWLPLEANGDAAVRACEKLPSHPTLPRIRQTGQMGGSAFVAMDFPEGQLLSTMVGGGERLDVDLVIRVGAQLSDALSTVHDQQVVHGELSPDSVLLVPADRAYLWDMPLVIANRLTDRRGENRLMQNLVKTAPYLAPERARGEGASREADVYSLGVVLCVSAGAPIPTAATTLGVVHQVAAGTWTPRVPSLLPDPWRATLTRMVAMDPAQRPTAREVAQVFAELPVPAALPTVPEFPVVRLPPSLLAAADALMKKPPTLPIEPVPVPAAREATTDRMLPRPAMTLEAPVVDVVRIPTTEIEAIESTPAVAVVPPPPPPSESVMVAPGEPVVVPPPLPANVQLTESVSVAPELHEAGARTVPAPEPTTQPDVPSRRRRLGTAAVVAGAAAVLLVVGFSPSPKRGPQAEDVIASPAKPIAKAAAPARTEEDELAPLPHLTPRNFTPAVAKPAARRAPRVLAPEPALESKPAPAASVVAPAAATKPEVPLQDDFSFLEGADAPKSALAPSH